MGGGGRGAPVRHMFVRVSVSHIEYDDSAQSELPPILTE
jgi:hypothetical protein